MEIKGEMVGYDCILFSDTFPILSPVCHEYFCFTSWQNQCHDPCPALGTPALVFTLNYYSALMQKSNTQRNKLFSLFCRFRQVEPISLSTTQKHSSETSARYAEDLLLK